MRVLLIAAITQALMLGPGFATPAAPPAHADETPDATAPIISINPVDTLVEPGDEYAFEFTITNPSATPIAAGEAEFFIDTEPVFSVPDLLADEAPSTASPSVEQVETPALAPDEEFETTFVVQAQDFPLARGDSPGVYRTGAEWSGDDAHPVQVATSPLVWQAEHLDTTLELASAFTAIYPENEAPPTEPQQVNTALEEQPEIANLAALATQHSSLLGVDPRFHAYGEALGGITSDASRELIETLTGTLGNSFPLQFADADPVLTSQFGDEEQLLSPEGLTYMTQFHSPRFELVESDFAHRDELPEGPSGEHTMLAPPLEELLNWETSHTGVAWPSTQTLSAETLDALGARGFHTVIASGPQVNGSPRGQVGETTVLHSHAELEQVAWAFAKAEEAWQVRDAQSQLAALTAVLSLPSTPTDHAQAFLAVDREISAHPETVEALFSELTEMPWVDTISTDQLREGAVTVDTSATPEAVIDEVRPAVENESAVADFSRVLEDPQLLVDYQRARLLQLIAVQHLPADIREITVSDHLISDADLLDGVSLVNTENTRLLGTTSRIPVQVRNTLPFTAIVEGTALPGSAAISVPDPPIAPTLIAPESTETAIITVQSRLSSGQSSLIVNLNDTHTLAPITTHVFDLTLSGDTEFIALGVLGAIILALLIGGVWRSWRRRRGNTATAITTDPGPGNS